REEKIDAQDGPDRHSVDDPAIDREARLDLGEELHDRARAHAALDRCGSTPVRLPRTSRSQASATTATVMSARNGQASGQCVAVKEPAAAMKTTPCCQRKRWKRSSFSAAS